MRAREVEVSKLEQLPGDWATVAARAITKAEQVNFVILAMRKGIYHRGLTTLAVARLWNLDESAVVDRELEALRSVQRVLDAGSEQVRAELVLTLHALVEGAVNRCEQYVTRTGELRSIAKPDYRSAVAAVAEIKELAGLAKTKLEIDVRDLSEEQIHEQLRLHGVEVKLIETTGEEKRA